MAGLSFGSQGGRKQSFGGGSDSTLWWVPLVLAVVAVALMTLYVRAGGGGVFAVVRGGVQTVTQPIANACSVLSTPFNAAAGYNKDEELEALKTENSQLRTLVAELEEYRQQDSRLTSLVKISDMYGLETVSAEVTAVTSGWDRTATINKGSGDGIRVGMGVLSSCGLYGQVESVTASTSVVRLANDADSSTSAMVQSSHARGLVKGAYDGTLTMEYVSIDTTVGEGDVVISSGQGGTYPRGLVIGLVSNVEDDASKLYYRITVDPIYSYNDCEEVMVLTGNETETASLLDKDMIEQITSASSSAVSTDASTGTDSTGGDGKTASGSTDANATKDANTADAGTASGSSSGSGSSGGDGNE